MLIPKVLVGLPIILIGVVPVVFVVPVSRVTQVFTGDISMIAQTTTTLSYVAMGSLLFIGLIIVLLIVRNVHQKEVKVAFGPTWGCGYSGGDPAKHQYTATSYVENYHEIVGAVANIDKHFLPINKEEVFPGQRKFETQSSDYFENHLVNRPIHFFTHWLERSAIFQTGKLQHYVLYALVFLVTIFLLTFFKFI